MRTWATFMHNLILNCWLISLMTRSIIVSYRYDMLVSLFLLRLESIINIYSTIPMDFMYQVTIVIIMRLNFRLRPNLIRSCWRSWMECMVRNNFGRSDIFNSFCWIYSLSRTLNIFALYLYNSTFIKILVVILSVLNYSVRHRPYSSISFILISNCTGIYYFHTITRRKLNSLYNWRWFTNTNYLITRSMIYIISLNFLCSLNSLKSLCF